GRGAVGILGSRGEPRVEFVEIARAAYVFVILGEGPERMGRVDIGPVLLWRQLRSFRPVVTARDGAKPVAGAHSPQAAAAVRVRIAPRSVDGIAVEREPNEGRMTPAIRDQLFEQASSGRVSQFGARMRGRGEGSVVVIGDGVTVPEIGAIVRERLELVVDRKTVHERADHVDWNASVPTGFRLGMNRNSKRELTHVFGRD